MYKIIIIQQQLALNSRANCSDMMFHTINSISHLLLLIKKQLSQMKEHPTIVSWPFYSFNTGFPSVILVVYPIRAQEIDFNKMFSHARLVQFRLEYNEFDVWIDTNYTHYVYKGCPWLLNRWRPNSTNMRITRMTEKQSLQYSTHKTQ